MLEAEKTELRFRIEAMQLSDASVFSQPEVGPLSAMVDLYRREAGRDPKYLTCHPSLVEYVLPGAVSDYCAPGEAVVMYSETALGMRVAAWIGMRPNEVVLGQLHFEAFWQFVGRLVKQGRW